MPIELPNLDDRRFADLVEEGIGMIARHAPEWTNHNPSDPGITLIELLAYFAEMLSYRLDRVGREHLIRFLRLLEGDRKQDADDRDASFADLEEAIRQAVLSLREPQRAVTREDFEYLARRAVSAAGAVRAYGALGRNLTVERSAWEMDRPGHVSVVLVPDYDLEANKLSRLLDTVRDDLEPRRLLTTRVHVVPPCYVWVSLRIDVSAPQETPPEELRERAVSSIEQYFSPFAGGGPGGKGWPFGRPLYLSEVVETLYRRAGIRDVAAVRVVCVAASRETLRDERSAAGIQIGIRSTVAVDSRLGVEPALGRERLLSNNAGELVAVALRPYELLRIIIRPEHIRVGEGLARHRPMGMA